MQFLLVYVFKVSSILGFGVVPLNAMNHAVASALVLQICNNVQPLPSSKSFPYGKKCDSFLILGIPDCAVGGEVLIILTCNVVRLDQTEAWRGNDMEPHH